MARPTCPSTGGTFTFFFFSFPPNPVLSLPPPPPSFAAGPEGVWQRTPPDCSNGTANVFINGRQLQKKELSLLLKKGLPDFPGAASAWTGTARWGTPRGGPSSVLGNCERLTALYYLYSTHLALGTVGDTAGRPINCLGNREPLTVLSVHWALCILSTVHCVLQIVHARPHSVALLLILV